MLDFKPNIKIDKELFTKLWPTKCGYVLTSIIIVFIALAIEKNIVQICSLKIPANLMPYITLSWILLPLIVHDAVWRFFTGRVVLFFFNKILIAIHPSVLREYKDLKTILTALIKERHVGNWFKVIVLPEDLILNDSKKAEAYLFKKGLDLLIWGESISGQVLGKEVSQYKIKFTYSFNCPSSNTVAKTLLIRDFNALVKERYWRVHKENSLQDISLLGENITEIGLYIIAICLFSRGGIIMGLNILEDLFIKICSDPLKKKMLIYPKIRNHLISVYNLLSLIAWKEEGNKPKSIALTKKVLSLDPDNYDSHVRMALYEYQEGRIPESRRQVNLCRRINPRHPCTIFDQSFYAILDRKYDKAAALYKKLNHTIVDGLIAFEVAGFLEEEYIKKKEIGFLFAAGFVNTKFVDHTKLGLIQLKKFCKLAKEINEYIDFYNLAKGTISNFKAKHFQSI